MFKSTERNFDKIQFEKLRKIVDPKFNEIHDELSESYYDKKPFRNYGILDKETFDKLHGLIFTMRDVKFHTENLKLQKKDRILESEYNEIKDENGNVIGNINQQSLSQIASLKIEGLELNI